MKSQTCCALALFVLVFIGVVAASDFRAALDQIVSHHREDTTALGRTLDSLTHITARLQSETENPKYRNIRLLNKTFWERVGSVNGGISFMYALGFELLQQGTADGPCFQPRTGAPVEADLNEALNLLSARRVQLERPGAHREAKETTGALPTSSGEFSSTCARSVGGHGSGFNPFATAFSRRSHTHLQERAEQGLAHLVETQSRWHHRFSKLEERNVTILLPRTRSTYPKEAASREKSTGSKENKAEEKHREVELVAQLWRERMNRDDVEQFETNASKTLRLLRTAKVYPYVLIRVRLPGGVCLQARFNPEENLKAVYQVVETILSEEVGDDGFAKWLSQNFELFTAPPTRVFQRDGTTLKEFSMRAPACLLHLRWQGERTQVERWASKIDEAFSRATSASRHSRIPYSSRYDVPEPISLEQPQDPRHAGGASEDVQAESDSDAASAGSPSH